MNVLLLYPEFPATFWSFKHALKFVGKRASLPPLGLLTVASMLPREWNLKLVDTNVGSLSSGHLKWADMVMISAMIAQRESVEELIARCKAAGKTVVAGGPLFTSEKDKFPTVDHFVLNEAEITLPPFLRDFAEGKAQRVYSAIEFADVATTPVPRWDLAKLGRYASMCLQYSRGCPFDCEFCDVTTKFGHKPRIKAAAQVIAELDLLHKLGWRGQVFFVDDNLIGNKRALRTELLPALAEWQRQRHHGLPFFTEASINLADDEVLMREMVDAGFDGVFIGIETPDETALAECHKRQNQKRDLVEDVKRIQRTGLQVQGGFIVGFDSDTSTIFRRQIEFIQRSGIVTAMVGLLNALPDTRLHARMKREGRLMGDSTGNNVDGTINFIPRMDLEKLRAGYRGILEHIYAPGPYYQRVRTFLREYRRPRYNLSMDWRRLFAFFYAGVRLGVLGRERFHYWYLLLWTSLHRPAHLSLAVTLAIYGHHFRKCMDAVEA